jgi:hypothetical protein
MLVSKPDADADTQLHAGRSRKQISKPSKKKSAVRLGSTDQRPKEMHQHSLDHVIPNALEAASFSSF